MKAINSSIDTGCPSLQSSNCVKWDGPNISALGIKSGDNITKVEYSIATKVCNLSNQLDLSTIDLTCLEANIPASHYDLKHVLQYILDNQCTLKSLIDSDTNSGTTGTVDITSVNLKCVKKFDAFENEVHQTIQQAIQSIVDEVCNNKADIANLKVDINDLQEQIDAINPTPTVTIPNVSTCISTSKPVTTALQETSAVLCELKGIVGETLDIQDAMSKQATGLKTKIGNPNGFIDTVNTLSDSVNNMWLSINNLLARVAYIESTCCAPSCDILKIGFIVDFLEDDTVNLRFTTGSGTVIPLGFEDCGSEITVTNQDGLSFGPIAITISQAGVVEGIDISSFKSGDMLVFSVMAKMCNGDLHCEKCVGKEIKYTPNGCCVITNNTSDPVTLIYSVPASSNT